MTCDPRQQRRTANSRPDPRSRRARLEPATNVWPGNQLRALDCGGGAANRRTTRTPRIPTSGQNADGRVSPLRQACNRESKQACCWNATTPTKPGPAHVGRLAQHRSRQGYRSFRGSPPGDKRGMSADRRRALMKGNVERDAAGGRLDELDRGIHRSGLIPSRLRRSLQRESRRWSGRLSATLAARRSLLQDRDIARMTVPPDMRTAPPAAGAVGRCAALGVALVLGSGRRYQRR